MDDKQLSAQEADEIFQHQAIQRDLESHRRHGARVRTEAEIEIMETALRMVLQDAEQPGRQIRSATEIVCRAALEVVDGKNRLTDNATMVRR